MPILADDEYRYFKSEYQYIVDIPISVTAYYYITIIIASKIVDETPIKVYDNVIFCSKFELKKLNCKRFFKTKSKH